MQCAEKNGHAYSVSGWKIKKQTMDTKIFYFNKCALIRNSRQSVRDNFHFLSKYLSFLISQSILWWIIQQSCFAHQIMNYFLFIQHSGMFLEIFFAWRFLQLKISIMYLDHFTNVIEITFDWNPFKKIGKLKCLYNYS